MHDVTEDGAMDITEWIILAGTMSGVIVAGVVVWRRRVIPF